MKSRQTWTFRTASADMTDKCCHVLRNAIRSLSNAVRPLNVPGAQADQAPVVVPLNPPVPLLNIRIGPRGTDIARCGPSQPLRLAESRKTCDVCFERFDVNEVPD